MLPDRPHIEPLRRPKEAINTETYNSFMIFAERAGTAVLHFLMRVDEFVGNLAEAFTDSEGQDQPPHQQPNG